MKKLSLAVLLPVAGVALAPVEAKAQSSSTNCISLGGGMVHCDTTQTGRQSQDGGATLGRGIADLINRGRDRSFRRRLGQMIANGDCRGAARYALERGELDAAERVSELCRPREAAARPSPTSDWVQYARSTTGLVFYYDRSSVARQPSNTNVRVLVDHRNDASSDYPYAELMLMLRCDRRDYALTYLARLDSQRRVVTRSVSPQLEFDRIDPDSAQQPLLDAVCP